MTARLGLRLGWRLLRAGGARARVSRVLVAVGVCLGVLAAFICVAASTVASSQAQRSADRSFVIANDDSGAQAFTAIARMPFQDRMLLRVDVDALRGDLDLPPGLARWPQPGEVFLSPAAADLRDNNPIFTDYAPGEIAGVVGDAGLRGPSELVAYRGVDRADLPRGGLPTVNAGESGSSSLDTAPPVAGQIAALTILMTLLVGLPAVAFLAVASRLSASTRRNRLAVLRFLGAPEKLVRRVNGVENLTLALLGWITAVLLFPVVNALIARSQVLGTSWFARDTALSPAMGATSAVAVVALALLASARTALPSTLTRAAARQQEPFTPRSPWRLAPLAVGFTSLMAQVVSGFSRPPGVTPVRLDLAMSGAILLTGIGLVLALPDITRWAGLQVSRRGRTLGARLGGTRAAFEPRASSNLALALALLVMASAVTIGQTKDARAVSEPTANVVSISVSANELPPGAAAAIRADVTSPAIALLAGDPTQPPVTLAVGTCATVRELLTTMAGSDFADCTQNAFLLRGSTTPATVASIGTTPLTRAIGLADLPRDTLPDAVATFLAEGGVDGLITTDPQPALDAIEPGPTLDSSGATTYTEDARLLLAVPRQDVEAVLGVIYRYAPYSQPTAIGLDPDSGQNIALINGFIRLGLILATAMTAIAIAAALADRATTRRRADHDLLVAGAPHDLIRTAHRWEVAAILAPGTLAALITGTLGGLAWQFAGGLDRTPDWTAILTLVTLSTAGVAALTWLAPTVTPKAIDPEAMRST